MQPLYFQKGHLFVEIDHALWLLDTGAPNSFGSVPEIVFAGETFALPEQFMGLTATTLSSFVAVECAGIIGSDIMGCFDFIFDPQNEEVEISAEELEVFGQQLPVVDNIVGVPIVSATVAGDECLLFFDTGAQISYLQHDALSEFPPAGEFMDFHPSYGQFSTDTYHVDIAVAGINFTLRCGHLPELLGAILLAGSITGILGNEIMSNRRIGYFPRRQMIVL